MKKSNIILIVVVLISLSWLVISGWMQANAYNIIKTGNECSYAKVEGQENTQKLKSFKYIKIEADKLVITHFLRIEKGNRYNLSFSNSMKNAVSNRISGDTLYIKINGKTYGVSATMNITLPILRSLNISTKPDSSVAYNDSGINLFINGFNDNDLSILNMGQNNLRLYDNQIKKLVIRGNFYKGKEIEIDKSTSIDSLDIDVEGEKGSLIIGNNYFKTMEHPMKWSSIKVPGSVRVAASASIASKIILKK